ncbi:Ataxin-10 [Halotydeus destructor]|nr:Ataxin-10 [Halotydeus destructor]
MEESNVHQMLSSLSLGDNEEALISKLQHVTGALKTESIRRSLDGSDWTKLEQIITSSDAAKSSMVKEEIYRTLRNATAACQANKQFLLSSQSMLLALGSFAKSSLVNLSNEKNLALCLQFLVNFVSGEDEVSVRAKNLLIAADEWDFMFSLTNVLELSSKRSIFVLTSMLIYNCIKSPQVRSVFTSSEHCSHITECFLQDIVKDEPSEFSLWSTQLLLETSNFLPNSYSALTAISKLVLLEVVYETRSSAEHPIHETNWSFVQNSLRTDLLNIVRIGQPDAAMFLSPLEIKIFLELVCEMSTSTSQQAESLRGDRVLLETVLETLKTLHLLGKSESSELSSNFKPVSQLKKLNQMDENELVSSPVYCFKKHLIRLIGNMCYECPPNQELVGQLDGIPLLLDCCHIDARNPFIMQWAIFAVRNALQKNSNNQQILAGLSKHGIIENSQLLSELGLEIDDGQLKTKLPS